MTQETLSGCTASWQMLLSLNESAKHLLMCELYFHPHTGMCIRSNWMRAYPVAELQSVQPGQPGYYRLGKASAVWDARHWVHAGSDDE